MKAVTVVPKVQGSLKVMDVREPTPGADELLLRVLQVGVCGTDLDIVSGFYGEAPRLSPYMILGHESLCEVAGQGPEVSGFQRGDLVVPAVRRPCPDPCFNCRSGEPDMCLSGNYLEHGIKGLHGFGSELTTSESAYCVKLPRQLSVVGVLLEPLSIAEKGIVQTFAIQGARMKWSPRSALVLGTGAVGLLATALLRIRGLEVTAVARHPDDSMKAELASSLGATYVNSAMVPLDSLENRFDVVLEATGAASVALEAQNLCGVNGIVSYLGVYRSKVGTEDAGEVFSNLVLGNRAHFGSVNANMTHYVRGAKDLLEIGKSWPGFLEKMITAEFPISRGEEAYLKGGTDGVKTVVRF